MTEKQQDETIKGRILVLLQKGYTRSQLINDFDFAERTIDSAIKEFREQQGDGADEPRKGGDFDPKTLVLPAKLDISRHIPRAGSHARHGHTKTSHEAAHHLLKIRLHQPGHH